MEWMHFIPGLAVAVAGAGLSYAWFGVRRRNGLEAAAGAHALSAMKWRECAGLVLEALSREGYREESSSRQPGEGTEFLLRRGDDPVLLSYKHGSAYRLGDSNIREFANAIQLCGASHGLLVTLGSIEDVARAMAKRYEIKLLDGRDVWPLVRDLVPAGLQSSIRQQAEARIRTGLLTGIAASLALGILLVVLALGRSSPDPLPSQAAVPDAPAAPGVIAPSIPAKTVPEAAPAKDAVAGARPTTPPAAATPLSSQESIEAANRALREIAKLDEDALARRRAEAAQRVAGMPGVRTAAWSTQSTLVISLAGSDGKDSALVTEACAALARFEELRFTRLQLEPPAGSSLRVRWRMCQ